MTTETEHAKVESRETREIEINVNFFQKLTIRFVHFRPLMTLLATLHGFSIAGTLSEDGTSGGIAKVISQPYK